MPASSPLLDEGAELYDRYLTAWSQPDPETIAAVYTPLAVVEDTLAGRTWSGHDDILAGIDDEAQTTLEAGPWPNLMSFNLDGRSELLAVVQTTGACPALEARRWFLRDGRITREVRYHHVPSARRCDLDLADGWWDGLNPPDSGRGVSKQKISVDEDVVEVVNAEWEQLEFVRWVFERFRLGLDNPRISVAVERGPLRASRVRSCEYDIYEVSPRPTCEELTARYELLTGRLPLTTCSGSDGG